jgi:hypothetical protein
MADISDPQVVRFSNEVVRPVADRMAQFFYFAESANDQFNANPDLLKALLSGATIDDGADKDGRPILTADTVKVLFTQVQQFVDDFRANDNAKLNIILAAAAHPR